MMMSRRTYYIERFLAIVAAIILVQTLYYKFTGHPDSTYIFNTMGLGDHGRIILGIVELLTAIFLLHTRTAVFAALVGVIIMLGALMSHFFVLGIVIRGDGGTLFILAIITFSSCLYSLFARSDQFYAVITRLTGLS